MNVPAPQFALVDPPAPTLKEVVAPVVPSTVPAPTLVATAPLVADPPAPAVAPDDPSMTTVPPQAARRSGISVEESDLRLMVRRG